jgi:hypothetical protein
LSGTIKLTSTVENRTLRHPIHAIGRTQSSFFQPGRVATEHRAAYHLPEEANRLNDLPWIAMASTLEVAIDREGEDSRQSTNQKTAAQELSN